MKRFSLRRWWAIVLKEFLQLKRDRITFGMIVGLPIGQLFLFGYAINSDPKHLPTAVVISEHSEFTRSYLQAMKTSGYFDFVQEFQSEDAARTALARGDIQFVVNFPADFTRKLLRGERPALLIEADATDPSVARYNNRIAFEANGDLCADTRQNCDQFATPTTGRQIR